jgi:predicted methyltransferase
MWPRVAVVPRIALSLFFAALASGCAAAAQLPAAPPPPPPPSRDETTAAALELVLAGEHRPADNRARDTWRHPLDTLLFFGITADMTVAEVWPDSGGWYTELLAPLLAERGKLYVAQPPPAPANRFVTATLAGYSDKLAARPDLYGKVTLTTLGPDAAEIAPPGSCDMVVTFRGIHNWMNLGYAPQAFEAMARALKPGGILGVVGHRADPARPQDPRAGHGYVNEAFAIGLIEAAGFELVERSEINANPNDTKDYEQGVWVLPPTYRAGNRDRDKYQAIGESDRFTLKFRKKGAASMRADPFC